MDLFGMPQEPFSIDQSTYLPGFLKFMIKAEFQFFFSRFALLLHSSRTFLLSSYCTSAFDPSFKHNLRYIQVFCCSVHGKLLIGSIFLRYKCCCCVANCRELLFSSIGDPSTGSAFVLILFVIAVLIQDVKLSDRKSVV